jgi:site-specific DNA-cytosine methylase
MCKEPLRAIDLCCGAGGWACAARGLPIRWVAVADLAADCIETWELNHAADHPDCRRLLVDLANEDGIAAVRRAAEGVDLVVGGIPCEELSCARGAAPVTEARMSGWYAMTDNVLRLVAELSPRWWAIEDVIQIERHLPLPIEIGWTISWRRIEAGDFGPQRRLRTFLGEFPDPQPEPGPRTLGDCLRPGPHRTIAAAESYSAHYPGHHNSCHLGRDRLREIRAADPCPTVMGGINRGSRQRRAFMTRGGGGRLRQIDWRELAIAQGFPEDYLFVGGYQRVEKMIGQAISIHVGRAILKAILRERAECENAVIEKADPIPGDVPPGLEPLPGFPLNPEP